MSKINDIKQYKKIKSKQQKKHKRRIIFLSIIVVLIIFLIARIVASSNSVSSGIDSQFPLTISSQAILFSGVDDDILVSTSSEILVYNDLGNESYSYTHGCSNPVTKVNGDVVVTYSQGGKKCIVQTGSSTQQEIETEKAIIFCEVSEYGYIAVATYDEKYTAIVTIYNDKLTEIFKYNMNEYPVDMSFTSMETFVVVTQSVDEGSYKSTIYGLDVKAEEETFITEVFDVLPIEISEKKSGNIALTTLDKVIFLTKDGEELAEYEFFGEIVSIDDTYLDYTLLAIESQTKQSETTIVSLDHNGEVYGEVAIQEQVSDIICDSRGIAVLIEDEIIKYNYNTKEIGRIDLTKSFDKIIRINGNIYGLNNVQIDRIS